MKAYTAWDRSHFFAMGSDPEPINGGNGILLRLKIAHSQRYEILLRC